MGWLSERMKRDDREPTVFVVLGVTKVGDWRDFKVLNSFSLSSSHIRANSPILVDSPDAMNFDYVMVVREDVAKRNGWLKL
jgi:hypothetical protein